MMLALPHGLGPGASLDATAITALERLDREAIIMSLSKEAPAFDPRLSNDGDNHPGDIAISDGRIVQIREILPPTYLRPMSWPQRAICEPLSSPRGTHVSSFGHIYAQTVNSAQWFLKRAKRHVDGGETRWLVDKSTGEMLRVATRYDVWLFDELGRAVRDGEKQGSALMNDVRKRYALVDGVAWMTTEGTA